MPTGNNLFFCYLCTFEFLYSNQSWSTPGELRHRLGELSVQWMNPLDKVIVSELELLSENLDFITEIGIAFGLYAPPEVPQEKSAAEKGVVLAGFDNDVETLDIIVDHEEESLVVRKRYVIVVSLPSLSRHFNVTLSSCRHVACRRADVTLSVY
jgi:hypothetical protein